MEEIEERVERLLAKVPGYVWDGATLPVPIDDIADTHFGLLILLEHDLAGTELSRTVVELVEDRRAGHAV